MALSLLHNFKCVLSIVCGASGDPIRFLFVSSVVDLTWNIELGCQGEADRWWRGSTRLPEVETQTEVLKQLSASNVRVSGWKETRDCMLKVTFNLPQLQKLSVVLKEYSSEESSRHAMRLLFEAVLNTPGEQAAATSTRNFKGISVADLRLREREQTISELRRRISMLERTLESRPPPEAPPALRKTPTIPPGASLANPSKRRRIVQDMRFDGE